MPCACSATAAVSITRQLRGELGFEPKLSAIDAARELMTRPTAGRVGPPLHPGVALARLAGRGDECRGGPAQGRGHRGSEALARFLREIRTGVEAGVDPVTAAGDAVSSLPRVAGEAIETIPRRLRGEYSEDEWGFDEDFAEAVFPLFRFLYEVWWRVDVEGVRNVPAHGRGLMVANHAGSLFPFDASMMTMAVMREHPLPRWPRFMVLDWAFVLPFLSGFMRRVGGVPAIAAQRERAARA